MKVIDPGHCYDLLELDGEWSLGQRLTFVKRLGDNYPGNEPPAYAGTTMQEVLRAVIHRARYVNNQIPCRETNRVINLCTTAVFELERRAARRHGRVIDFTPEIAVIGAPCLTCGHIHCDKHRRQQ